MKIIHTVSSLALSAGGPTRTVTFLCSALGQQGAQVALFSTQASEKQGSELLLAPEQWVTTTLVSKDTGWLRHPLHLAPLRTALLQHCRIMQPTVLHDNGIWMPSNHTAAAVARATGVPLVISPRGMLEPWALNHQAWKKRLALLLYQRRDLETAAVLHATADQEVDNLRRLGLGQPIAMVPNGVQFPADAVVDCAIAERLRNTKASANHIRTALFLSRIHHKKGLFNLVDAWARMRPVGWRLVIAGPDEGGHKAQVVQRVQSNGLGDVVTFAGEVDGDAKTALYCAADLFVLPTFSENFGVVVAEALAHGLPVVTTRGAPWADLEKFGCGWWVDVGVDPLVRALQEAMALSDDERLVMGQRGREYVRRYEWDGIAKEMMAVYRWMLRQGPKPDCVRLQAE